MSLIYKAGEIVTIKCVKSWKYQVLGMVFCFCYTFWKKKKHLEMNQGSKWGKQITVCIFLFNIEKEHAPVY